VSELVSSSLDHDKFREESLAILESGFHPLHSVQKAIGPLQRMNSKDMLKGSMSKEFLGAAKSSPLHQQLFPPRRISSDSKKAKPYLAPSVDISLSTLPSSRILIVSSDHVFAQNIADILVLDDVGCVSETLHVDGVDSHGKDHVALVDDTLNTHNVNHTDSHSTSLDTGSLAVDIGFEISEREDMLLANDDVTFFSLLDVVAKTVTRGHAVEDGAREDGETLAKLVAVAAGGFVFDCQAFSLVRILQHKLSVVLHAKVDDQALEEGCSVAKRVQPIHDLILDLELGLLCLVVFGNWRLFSEDAEGVDSKVERQDTLAKVSVDAG
jgi:hypothetical protein